MKSWHWFIVAALVAVLVLISLVRSFREPTRPLSKSASSEERVVRPNPSPSSTSDQVHREAIRQILASSDTEDGELSGYPGMIGLSGLAKGASLDQVCRTPANEAKIRAWSSQGRISEETVDILLGNEHRPEILKRNLANILEILQGTWADPLLMRYAIASLGLFSEEESLTCLMSLAQGAKEDWAREASYYALSSSLPESTAVADVLLKALADGNRPSLRFSALQVLANARIPIPVNSVLDVVETDSGITAQVALSTIASQDKGYARVCLEYVIANTSNEGLRGHAQTLLTEVLDQRGGPVPSKPSGIDVIKSNNAGVSQELRLSLIAWPPRNK